MAEYRTAQSSLTRWVTPKKIKRVVPASETTPEAVINKAEGSREKKLSFTPKSERKKQREIETGGWTSSKGRTVKSRWQLGGTKDCITKIQQFNVS